VELKSEAGGAAARSRGGESSWSLGCVARASHPRLGVAVCVVLRVLDYGGQVTKGAWGMSWRQKAKKGVEVCDKPGEVDKRAMIPGFPN
jgi:hypothetical protein